MNITEFHLAVHSRFTRCVIDYLESLSSDDLSRVLTDEGYSLATRSIFEVTRDTLGGQILYFRRAPIGVRFVSDGKASIIGIPEAIRLIVEHYAQALRSRNVDEVLVAMGSLKADWEG